VSVTALRHHTYQQCHIRAFFLHGNLKLLWFFAACPLAVPKNNFRRLLRTVEALSDLGPELTAERDFAQSAQLMLAALMEAAAAREGALFTFSDKPSLLTSAASRGFALIPDPAVIPLLPRHSMKQPTMSSSARMATSLPNSSSALHP
jgi:hypothetical protein